MITRTSTYDECVQEINEAADEMIADYPDVSPDEFWTDLAESMLYDASEEVAREVFRCQVGWVPQTIEEHWKRRR